MRGLAVGAALVAAVFIPGGRPGIAVPIVAALMLGVLGTARVSPLRLTFVGLALALAAQAALLDAPWVVVLDLAAAWLVAALAAGGLSFAALAAPVRLLRHAPALAPRPEQRHIPALRGVVLSTIVVLPFLLLFLSADAAFAGFAGGLPLPSGASLPGRLFVLAVVLTGALGLGLSARSSLPKRAGVSTRRLSFPEWAIPLALLNVLFAAFVAVQVAVLFGGHDRVIETAGLTYAEYARSGFWQLLTATTLTFLVVGAALAWARPDDRRRRVVLRVLLGCLCALTTVVLASALHRLRLYEDAFGLTRLRLLAETAALWLGAMLALAAAAALTQRARKRVPAAAALVTSLGLLAFSLSDPDRRVAQRNIDHWRATGQLDLAYLAKLSADATPELLKLPAPARGLATAGIRARVAATDSWGSANRSRARARVLLRG